MNGSPRNSIRNSYYVYELIDPRSGETFYVGKGYGTRMYAHKTEATKGPEAWTNPHKCRKILKILNSGNQLIYKYELCENEQAAVEKEERLIMEYVE